MHHEREVEIARRAAQVAGEAALRLRERGIEAEAKPDDSPVTAADRESERIIAGMLTEAFPDDGLLGEEGTERQSRSGRRWIIDPIDGTRDFVRGYPGWAVLIGLEVGAEVEAGVVHLPVVGQTFTATRGGGAYRNGERIRVSSIATISQAVLFANGLKFYRGTEPAARLVDWMAEFWAVRTFGGCPDAMLLASGRGEVYLEPHVKAWDLAPLKVILEEAGARFFNFDGGSSIHGGTCAACVPALEAEVRRFLRIGGE